MTITTVLTSNTIIGRVTTIRLMWREIMPRLTVTDILVGVSLDAVIINVTDETRV